MCAQFFFLRWNPGNDLWRHVDASRIRPPSWAKYACRKKVKYTLRRTHENVLNHILFTCAMCDKFLVANGRPAGCLGGLGHSNMDYLDGRRLFSLQRVQMERFLNPQDSSDVCVRVCARNHLVSAKWIISWVVRLCVFLRLFTTFLQFHYVSWRDSSSGFFSREGQKKNPKTFWWHFRWRPKILIASASTKFKTFCSGRRQCLVELSPKFVLSALVEKNFNLVLADWYCEQFFQRLTRPTVKSLFWL